MLWKEAGQDRQAPATKREHRAACEPFAVIAQSLRIQPAGPTLSYEELAGLIERLRRSHGDGGVNEIVFDLSRVEMIGPQWTLVLALLIGFARSVTARCRVTSLHGQPASVVELYRHNRDLALLVADRPAG